MSSLNTITFSIEYKKHQKIRERKYVHVICVHLKKKKIVSLETIFSLLLNASSKIRRGNIFVWFLLK